MGGIEGLIHGLISYADTKDHCQLFMWIVVYIVNGLIAFTVITH
jgi:hypothetical protein